MAEFGMDVERVSNILVRQKTSGITRDLRENRRVSNMSNNLQKSKHNANDAKDVRHVRQTWETSENLSNDAGIGVEQICSTDVRQRATAPPVWPEYEVPLAPHFAWTPIDRDAPLAYVRLTRQGQWEVVACPFCGRKHQHNTGQGDPRQYLGGRVPHCMLGEEYRLVEERHRPHQPPRQRFVTVRRSIERDVRARVWDKTDGNCFYCGTPTNPFRNFEVDHYQPVSKGGTNDLNNLVPCCSRCNARKGDRSPETLRRGNHPFYGEMHQGDSDE